MGQGRQAFLACDVCGEKRWGTEGSPCLLTKTCDGHLIREGHAHIVVEGKVGSVAWTQPALFEVEVPKTKDPT